eukprot:2460045-Rhodomonas_salina.1
MPLPETSSATRFVIDSKVPELSSLITFIDRSSDHTFGRSRNAPLMAEMPFLAKSKTEQEASQIPCRRRVPGLSSWVGVRVLINVHPGQEECTTS